MSKAASKRDAVIGTVFEKVAPVVLADRLGVTPQALYQWKRVPPEHVLIVEEMSGVPCWEIRPDLYREPASVAS